MKHLLILSVAATFAITACNEKETDVAGTVSEATETVKDAASEAVSSAADSVKEAAADVVSKPGLSTDEEKLGYAFGHQFAKNLVAGQLQDSLSADAMAMAIKDSLSGAEQRMTDEEMRAAVEGFQAKAAEKAAAEAEAAKAKGVEFLAANKDKPGVVTTESGLQYIIVEEGKGAVPADDKSVEVNYKGSLIDGTVFDSSYDRGQSATFPLNGVIPGFTEGLKLMKEGGKIKLFIPSDLAYGVQAPPAIGPNQALIFEVELIAIK